MQCTHNLEDAFDLPVFFIAQVNYLVAQCVK